MPDTVTVNKSITFLTSNQMWDIVKEFTYYLGKINKTDNPEDLYFTARNNRTIGNSVILSLLKYMAQFGYPKDFPLDSANQTVCGQACQDLECPVVPFPSDNLSVIELLTEILQSVVGFVGIVGNLVAILVYLAGGSKFRTIFYRILLCLLMTYTAYIVLTLTSLFGRNFGDLVFFQVYAHFLYPMPSMMLHASTFLTVMLAWHRYNASKRPFEYYVRWKLVNPNVSAGKAISGCLIMSLVLVVPLFFEPVVMSNHYMTFSKINSSHVMLTNFTDSTLSISDLRLNPHYIVWYRNLIQFFSTIFIPFLLLAFWNFSTALILRQRGQNQHRHVPNILTGPKTVDSMESDRGFTDNGGGPDCPSRSCFLESDEARQSRILLVIVVVFAVCSLPRVILNLEEFRYAFIHYYSALLQSFTLNDSRLFSEDHKDLRVDLRKVSCFNPSVWFGVVKNISSVLMTLNASLGFFIYCIMCNDFRRDFAAYFSRLTMRLRHPFSNPPPTTHESNIELET